MNERIKQLAIQADIKFLEFHGKEYCEAWVEQQEKFAELIVQECVQVGGPEDSYTDEWFKAKADSVAKIREHFGVEE